MTWNQNNILCILNTYFKSEDDFLQSQLAHSTGFYDVQLTRYTDYGLRVLLYLACTREDVTVAEIAQQYGISRNHLVKVVHALSQKGYVQTTRGRAGGLRLAMPPELIGIGQVIRDLESNRALVECFAPETNTCPIAPVCALKGVLVEAEAAFQRELDKYTLADAMGERESLAEILLPTHH